VRFRQMPEMRRLVEDCYYDEDLLEAAKRFHQSEEFAAVISSLRPRTAGTRASVLDLGGGNGVASLAFCWSGFRAVLAEPDHSQAVGLGAIAPVQKQEGNDVGLCAAIGEALPFDDSTFDVVYTRQVLHHVSSLEVVCAEVFRVLKPKGVYIATREHVISRPGDLDTFLKNHPVHQLAGGENAHLLREYRGALNGAGFRKIRVLGPWESVINYYPMTCAQYASQCREAISRYIGRKAAARLATIGFVLRMCGVYRTNTDHSPGRLYSFLASR